MSGWETLQWKEVQCKAKLSRNPISKQCKGQKKIQAWRRLRQSEWQVNDCIWWLSPVFVNLRATLLMVEGIGLIGWNARRSWQLARDTICGRNVYLTRNTSDWEFVCLLALTFGRLEADQRLETGRGNANTFWSLQQQLLRLHPSSHCIQPFPYIAYFPLIKKKHRFKQSQRCFHSNNITEMLF